MAHPFESTEHHYMVLINEEGQHSLWPAVMAIPEGWHVVFSENTREACVDYVTHHWSDITPASLKEK
ncbi:MbtH family protein [Salipaludibacillus agaradhaerens]|uniref:MbtH family protein n=1 Tax=Salipaludibacillus agaradhaerens TaxID=76935 RepID=UPI00099698C5|nr:MbtH family NRPS accessory protein [Salipaludibacillus agaradhaerens]MCR6105083.1 MbtH family protein [Salipaludibacillus agaradhaerens]MCR6117128.1 MbtH family protein [Salipaludibacillus agaradhaerens]UJW56326.1 MbtH family protein [Bacillus sp. A116_S68]